MSRNETSFFFLAEKGGVSTPTGDGVQGRIIMQLKVAMLQLRFCLRC